MGSNNIPALIAEDIHKSFGPLEVLKGVSVTAENGDIISIIGSSGSGKSTFLRCINFLETPDRGRIVVGGTSGASGPWFFALAGYDSSGNLDPGFGGNGTGLVTSDLGFNSLQQIFNEFCAFFG